MAGQQVTLQGQITTDGLQQIAVGPPQPILSASCLGMCSGKEWEFVRPCCSGFCAATRCQPPLVDYYRLDSYLSSCR